MSDAQDEGPAHVGRGRWRDRDHTRAGLLGSLIVLSTPMLASSGLMMTAAN